MRSPGVWWAPGVGAHGDARRGSARPATRCREIGIASAKVGTSQDPLVHARGRHEYGEALSNIRDFDWKRVPRIIQGGRYDPCTLFVIGRRLHRGSEFRSIGPRTVPALRQKCRRRLDWQQYLWRDCSTCFRNEVELRLPFPQILSPSWVAWALREHRLSMFAPVPLSI